MKSIQLILIDANIGEKKLLTIIQKRKIKKWIALIPDYSLTLQIESNLKPYAQRLGMGGVLQEVAKKIRRPYYKLTAKLGEKNNSLEWWASSISERNTMVSRLYLNCCYVFVSKTYLEVEEDICIICDSVSVLKIIADIASKTHSTFLYESFSIKRYFRNGYTWNMVRFGYNLIRGWYRWLVAKLNLFYHRVIKRKNIKKRFKVDFILHTWVDEKCFGFNGEFHDRYFTILPAWLREKGYKVSIFTTIYSIKRSYWQAINFFRLKPEDYVIPEDFYKWYDYFFPVWIYFKKFRFKYKQLILGGVDVTSLFHEEKKREPVNFTTMNYILMKRLAQRGFNPLVIIDGFENMVSDKMIIAGARKYFRNTILNGFFHIPATLNILCNFIDKMEIMFAPLPDYIVCNGEFYREILEQEHYPGRKLTVGTALRYTYLWHRKLLKPISSMSGVLKILVPLSLVKNASIEIIQKVMGAVGKETSYKIYLKPHPMGLKFVEALPISILSRVEILTGSMDAALSHVDIILTGATSAALDGVLSGKPVIRIGRESDLDLDPLGCLKGFEKVFYHEEEIREVLKQYHLKFKNGESVINYDPNTLLQNLFAPPTEDFLNAFIPESLKRV